jgi:hypothetical protein
VGGLQAGGDEGKGRWMRTAPACAAPCSR